MEKRSTHAGLWFDRYFDLQHGDEAKRNLMAQTAQISSPKDYRTWYDRYRAALSQQEGVQLAIATAHSRLIVGLGDSGVAETGITLHHTYGVPYIPGSALKGLAAAYAHLRLDGDGWRRGRADHTIMFGTTETGGYITFFDAPYIPGSVKDDRPLAEDVMTVHHPHYYVGDTPAPPADWDSPNPVPFLTATGGYLIAVAGPQEWAQTALMILGMALRDMGIGAKTAAGYGRMQLRDLDDKPIVLPDETDEKPAGIATGGGSARGVSSGGTVAEPSEVTLFRRDIAQAQKNTLPNLVSRLEQLNVDPQFKRTLAAELIDRAEALKMNTAGKGWYERLLRLKEG
ncbi:type III-B CRISPR module RAMP protein Cmr6 [Roseiflexus sp.]|uniref:type III-B CRISPR module RAMP protein Cmr6 n=1 Tax=Roseiflexus sp. TaxID=2562120 RepID=UPI00398AACBD